MRDNEEAVENAKAQRRHREEIHCGNGFPMIAQKRGPSFCRPRGPCAFRIHRKTGRSETSKLSIVNSPWMRGAPWSGFRQPCEIRLRNSKLIRFLLPDLSVATATPSRSELEPIGRSDTRIRGDLPRIIPEQERTLIAMQVRLSALSAASLRK